MINFQRFLHTKNGKIILSLLLGFGLASLFRAVCKDKKCLIFSAPPLNEIDSKVFRVDNKCYSYKPVSTKCDTNKKIIPFRGFQE